MMPILIASDHAGYKLKKYVTGELVRQNLQFEDLGTDSEDSVDYPDFACKLSKKIISGEGQKGILICGTGLGMSMTANRFPEIRAALCLNSEMAEYARKHNDANVLVMGGRILSFKEAKDITDTFFSTEFSGGRHVPRIKKMERAKC